MPDDPLAPKNPRNTRSLEIPFRSMVLARDPDWSRDHKLQVEDERRPKVLHDWQHRGPYAPGTG